MKAVFISLPISHSRARPHLQNCWKSDQFLSHIYLQEQQKERSNPDRIFTLLHWHKFFPLYLCCWFCAALHAVMEMSDWFPLYDGLAWAGVWFGLLVTQTLVLSINLPSQGVGVGWGLTNTLKLKNYPRLFWVIVSVMELRGARQTEELSRDELMHSRCTVKRLQRAADFTAKVRIVTPQRLKISLWFILLFASSCGSSQQNQQMLTLDFTSQSRML